MVFTGRLPHTTRVTWAKCKGKLNDVFDEIRPKTKSKWPSSKIRGVGRAGGSCEISFSWCFSFFQAEYCHLYVLSCQLPLVSIEWNWTQRLPPADGRWHRVVLKWPIYVRFGDLVCRKPVVEKRKKICRILLTREESLFADITLIDARKSWTPFPSPNIWPLVPATCR